MVDPLEAKLGSRARVLLPIAICTLLALSAWRLWPRGPETLTIDGPTMGATFRVTVVADTFTAAQEAEIADIIESELALIDRLMSNYRSDSELTALSEHRDAAPFPLSPPLAEVLAIAAEVSELTEGAFDVTVPPLLRAWGFGPGADPDAPAPPPEQLAQLAERIGYQKLHLDLRAPSARKDHPELNLDLSAIAPGYAADRIASALTQRGFTRHYVDVGGELRVRGNGPSGQPWRVGIERPATSKERAAALQEIVHLSDHALATSGDYRNYRELDGRRISHTIDPRSRAPITHNLASVTVIHRDAARADALATALTVLGPDQGMALAEREGLAVLMIIRVGDTFELRSTPAFDALRRPASSATL
ncbi:MAG: FAD:protein FMN transferase [Nannocystis sp.]|nr:FAD:protein FMN transferase [Nannocystis sp.]